ncbi:ABC transporter substrate-binding protein [Candidatus Sulfurimonas marisnigri]|uniref:histidine kinase n=1 Tax=Candidatus Sulfurimonas marisnigri TaxID=2740405 RepID=A0A7S7M1W1_9BACT|nr:ABC transporter substrate-binding protein [Candidatus Sulfurimonas marisnigri]QOY54709.1 ABC transporter substrate-binding protein [Candidatus Sulfurimonas marisnigri]
MKYIFILLSLILSLGTSVHALDKVSLQLQWFDQFQFAGYYIAKEKGFYKEVGLDVQINKMTPSTDTLDEVLSGRSTFGIGSSSLIWEYSNKKQISLLSATFQSSPYVLIALKSSDINSIKDFKDQTVMLRDQDLDTASVHAMLHSGYTDENSIKTKDHTYDIEELIDGRVDLYAGYISNEPYLLKKRGIPYKIFSPKEKGFDFYSDILYTTKKEVLNNPKRVQKFKDASLKGWKYAFTNITETVDIIYNKYNSQNKTKDALMFEALELKKLAYANDKALGDINKAKVERILDVYKVLGFTNGNANIDNLLFTDGDVYLSVDEQKYLKEKKVIRICVAPSSLPYSAIEDGEFIGIGADILRLSQNITNIQHKLIETKTCKETFESVKNKECDLVPIMSKSKSREKHLHFTSPYYTEKLAIITKESTNYILDFTSIKNKEFSVVKGRSCAETLRQKYPHIKFVMVDSVEHGLSGVNRGDYYGHIDIMTRSAYYLQKMNKPNLKINTQLEDNVEIGFALRNDDKVLFSIYDKVSKNLRKSDLQKSVSSWVQLSYTNKIEFKYLTEIIIFIILSVLIFYHRHHTLSKRNKELKLLQDELLELNKTLESKVSDAVSEIQKKDTYMLHRSRLTQMGEIISMIAHQWKQPLGSISALNISMLMAIELEKYDLKDEKQREEFLEFFSEKLKKIDSHALNLSNIISDFRDFYKPSAKVRLMHMEAAVIKAHEFLKENLASCGIAVMMDLNSKKEVELHENEFIQVVLNILGNAKEQLVQKEIDNPEIFIKTYDDKTKVILEISDNAGGISEDIIENIFEPYFSTKLDKNGTGLGLYMSKSIIKEHHNGKIYAKNSEVGAVFIIEMQAKERIMTEDEL